MNVLLMIAGLCIAGGFVFLVLYWWSEGIYNGSDAILLVVIFSGLIIGMFMANSTFKFWLAFIPLLCSSAYVIYSFRGSSLRSIYKKESRNYIEAIQRDPRNVGARELLATYYYASGELDRAIDEMQTAVNMGAGQECQYKLARWQKEKHLEETSNPVCRWCETENLPGTKLCSKCGFELPYETGFSRWLTGGRTSQARVYLIIVAGIALTSLSIAFLPLKYAFVPIILSFFAIIGWILLGSTRS